MDDEITVSIPKDAFGQDLRIMISGIDDAPTALNDAGLKLVSSIFEITKSVEGSFKHPVTITLKLTTPLTLGQIAAIYYFDEKASEWVKIGGAVQGLFISAQVDHFTKFAAFVSEPTAHLSDVSGHWAINAIAGAIDNGIAFGYPDHTFKPNAQITRAEFAVMLSRALKLEGEASALNFKDGASIPQWASQHIALAVNAGLISGYEDGAFRPNQTITRAEIVSMIARVLQAAEVKSLATTFADDAQIPAWARSAVKQAVDAGIIKGRDGNRFAPLEQATRAEAVTILIAFQNIK